jgi:hypothetical protein
VFFLFYPKFLSADAQLNRLADVERVVRRRKAGLLMDVKGGSTLEELYLSVLVAQYELADALQRIHALSLDRYAVQVLKRFIALEPKGFGQNEDYHSAGATPSP